MPRRPLEPRARSQTAVARHRWAASLGPSDDQLLAAPLAEPLPDGLEEGRGQNRPPPQAQLRGVPSTEGRTPAPAVFRWRTGRASALLLVVVAVLLGGWFWWQAADGAPRVKPLDRPAAATPTGTRATDATDLGSAGSGAAEGAAAGAVDAGATGTGTATAGIIVVHVAGAVASPGVVELPAGSRLHQAVEAAGGSTVAADLDRLNLAAVLEDGQKILVQERGSPDAADPASPSGGSAVSGSAGSGGAGQGGSESDGAGSGRSGTPTQKVNLNTADAEELATLPRVGPILAQRIVDWRKQHGRFGSVQELDAVEGVGPKLLETLLPLVSV
ncbi:ComEA family DNA-binding protein [Arthrobacter sp. B3I4]|uniref:ComEA family DNA-binding protein n=1 Tax=Arthrobacter sp. B3I4 TaxID=3042267 RepID=UPI002787DBD6|nr:ComEA family DNA-binding protein [Arthrobacter sp. B3I4]MDQ0756354.1 competence protein ComEA [Arthrobacter sp. B3I4]